MNNRSRPLKHCLFLLLLAIILASCASPMAIPSPVRESEPTDSSLSPSPVNTATPNPPPVFSPTPAGPCPANPGSGQNAALGQSGVDPIIPGTRVTWFDDFLCPDYRYGWWTPNTFPSITIADGHAAIQANRSPNPPGALIRNAPDIHDGSGVLVSFRYSYGSSANFLLDAGTWLEDSYRGWALSINGDEQGHHYWDRWTGKYLVTTNIPAGILKPDTWYFLLLRLEDAGGITMKVWNKELPGQAAEFHLTLGSEWTGRNWKMQFQVSGGKVEVDQYWQMVFQPASD
jgi:hypothetical protein